MQLACLVLKSLAMYPSSCHVLKAISYVLGAKQTVSFDATPAKVLPHGDETEAALPDVLTVYACAAPAGLAV